MANVCHVGILQLKFLSANHFRDMFYVIKLNFVEIGGNVAEISHFFAFLKLNGKFT